MLDSIRYFKFKQRFNFLPIRAGAYLTVLRHNRFLDRREPFGFKLKNLEPRRLMNARSDLNLLLLLRRLGRETYRRLSYGTEAQYNTLLLADQDLAVAADTKVAEARIYHKSGRYQAYAGRVLRLRNRLSPAFSIRALNGSARNIYFPYAAYNYNRFDFFTRLRFRRKR